MKLLANIDVAVSVDSTNFDSEEVDVSNPQFMQISRYFAGCAPSYWRPTTMIMKVPGLAAGRVPGFASANSAVGK
jgi:hypothetical protein